MSSISRKVMTESALFCYLADLENKASRARYAAQGSPPDDWGRCVARAVAFEEAASMLREIMDQEAKR